MFSRNHPVHSSYSNISGRAHLGDTFDKRDGGHNFNNWGILSMFSCCIFVFPRQGRAACKSASLHWPYDTSATSCEAPTPQRMDNTLKTRGERLEHVISTISTAVLRKSQPESFCTHMQCSCWDRPPPLTHDRNTQETSYTLDILSHSQCVPLPLNRNGREDNIHAQHGSRPSLRRKDGH
ncbi:hypothetical protein OCU04_000245 [Sclerotinia nivalis]|uniref:Uncharacterized protein n=1 Tax=Sclerotinia nivalis TaxID=352851 RepID=A0A9X0AVQ4_9HELO|nr:hypothetical protein OCU04_000245 [Sclerotinia nivalis]